MARSTERARLSKRSKSDSIIPWVHLVWSLLATKARNPKSEARSSSIYAWSPFMFYFRQGPLYSTVCGGITPSAVGIWRTVVSWLPGYWVKCPSLLRPAVSATKMRPSLPPCMYAFDCSPGTEISAWPEVKATYLAITCQKTNKRPRTQSSVVSAYWI